MSQTIQIQVQNKIATTDFEEVVSYNSDYLLSFSLDGEWADYPQRIATVRWEDGGAEQMFEGTQCPMPAVIGNPESVTVGVYAVLGDRKIASTPVRLRCRESAHFEPHPPCGKSVQESLLAFLSGKDWSVFENKMESGTYSAVTVNENGLSTAGGNILEVGAEGQTAPSDKLVRGGVFLKKEDGTVALYSRTETGLEGLTLARGPLEYNLCVGEKRFNGSEKVTIGKEDLGLPAAALSGSYNDLTDKPTIPPFTVNSVNGKTGDVTIEAKDVGLDNLWNVRQMPFFGTFGGPNYNELNSTGFWNALGNEMMPATNAPVSASNPSGADGDWLVMIMHQLDSEICTQVAISLRADCAVRIRNGSQDNWTEWKSIFS